MEQIKSYIDANLIIYAADMVQSDKKLQALSVLNDSSRVFVVSDYVWLETMPKMQYQKMDEQARYVESLFKQSEFIYSNKDIVSSAKELAAKYGLSAMDALHAASAIKAGADELLTFEKPSKPFFRIPPEVLKVVSLHN